MIDLTFNLTTRVARLVQAATIKPGASVPVRITFSAAPGTLGTIQLALGTDAAAPEVLAYNDEFSEESETVYVAVLDANDARLIAHMVGKANAVVNLELIVPIDGEDNITPNLPITVQQRTVTGPEATEGGPSYYTQTEVDALIADLGPADLPSFAAHKVNSTDAQAITSGAGWTKVTFSGESYDVGGGFSSHGWQPGVAGKVRVSVALRIASSGGGTGACEAYFRVNNAFDATSRLVSVANIGSSTVGSVSGSATFEVTDDDVISVWIQTEFNSIIITDQPYAAHFCGEVLPNP